jgi:hypothetical protein
MNLIGIAKCKTCGIMFMFEREDLIVAFNAEHEETKRFVICPECWEHIKIEIENRGGNNEEQISRSK